MDAPAVAVSGDGKKVAVAWMDMRAGKSARRVFLTLSTHDGFEPEWQIDNLGVSEGEGHPCLFIDPAGGLCAAWETRTAVLNKSWVGYWSDKGAGGGVATLTMIEPDGIFPSVVTAGKVACLACEVDGKDGTCVVLQTWPR